MLFRQYICMAEDFLPEDFKVYQMRAEYKMQAKLGDIICPKAKAETGKVIVSLDDTDGKAYAIIEFQKNNGKNLLNRMNSRTELTKIFRN